jgi:hypothetical protein
VVLDFVRHAVANPTPPPPLSKQITTLDDNGQVPIHAACYQELFVPKCVICRLTVPQSKDGRGYCYQKHPFFQDWKYCESHEKDNRGAGSRRCTGCMVSSSVCLIVFCFFRNIFLTPLSLSILSPPLLPSFPQRVEPMNLKSGGPTFTDIQDANRCLCDSCCRSVILDSSDLKPLWSKILSFFELDLGLVVWPEMRAVPVMCVSYATLNEMSATSNHASSNAPVVRGLCLSETQTTTIPVPSMKFDLRRGYVQTQEQIEIGTSSNLTAVLCLSGLPKDLTASILAHEALHAW